MSTVREPFDPGQVRAALRGVVTGRVLVVPRTASTSTDLTDAVAADPGGWPDRSVLVADHQQAGRGRAGRAWSTPPHAALTVSALLRPGASTGGDVPVQRFGWVSLMTGLAVVQAMADVGVRAAVKWPNDVLVDAPDDVTLPGWGRRRKVAGVLGDMVGTPDGPAVVVGVGLNVLQNADELPVPSATSLTLASGAAVDRLPLLVTLLGRLVALDERWRAHGGDARAAGIAQECAAVCTTLGETVEVQLPGGRPLRGRATGLGADGALEVTDAAGRRHSVLAGDVHHLRTAPGPATH